MVPTLVQFCAPRYEIPGYTFPTCAINIISKSVAPSFETEDGSLLISVKHVIVILW